MTSATPKPSAGGHTTPIVDAAESDGWSGDAFACPPEIARKLELDRARLLEFVQKIHDQAHARWKKEARTLLAVVNGR